MDLLVECVTGVLISPPSCVNDAQDFVDSYGSHSRVPAFKLLPGCWRWRLGKEGSGEDWGGDGAIRRGDSKRSV